MIKHFFTLVCWMTIAQLAVAQTEDGWAQLITQDGITVYERTRDSSGGHEYKVVAEIPAPATDVVTFLSDFSHYQQFIAFFSETRMLNQVSPHEFYGYAVMSSVSTPVPTDVVLHAQFRDLSNGSWIGRASAVAGQHPPQAGLTRETSLEALWAIQNTGGTSCRYTYHYFIKTTTLNPAYIEGMAYINIENIARLRKIFSS